ncbi:uncharacterized protein N0V89_005485 [Didymosphaeria variabile]|uniref:BZIP domain-containing protein n=1 Tax=Didymosphaeria variabile TaxID=1932322 RepID=A0A9W8XKU9_9PLEO|nr:uncharacterized protein N0V89_005485 [Didymosphaeria variabile]KAJ4353755.1 hypothetical protein N0V89_005485 [Didymosphaeria variabile]
MTALRSVPTHKRTLAGGISRRPNLASDYGTLLGKLSKHYMPWRMRKYSMTNDLIVPDHLANEEPQNPYQKRREQVRRAQKTHRERKEAYIKSLETEVVQLRANEARLFRETKTLYAEINAMKALLANNGIPIPSTTPLPLPSPDQTTTEVGSGIDEFFEFSIPAKAPKQQHERIQVRDQDRRRGNQSGGTLTAQAKLTSTFDTILSASTTTLVSQQNPTAIGMDFILRYHPPLPPAWELRH